MKIPADLGVMPDSISHRRPHLQLQTGVLPKATTLGAVNRGNRVESTGTVQFFCPCPCLGQSMVAKLQQVTGGRRVIEEIKRQAVCFCIPKGMAVISFPGQPLGPNVTARICPMEGLMKLEEAKPDSLLVFGV